MPNNTRITSLLEDVMAYFQFKKSLFVDFEFLFFVLSWQNKILKGETETIAHT